MENIWLGTYNIIYGKYMENIWNMWNIQYNIIYGKYMEYMEQTVDNSQGTVEGAGSGWYLGFNEKYVNNM